MGIAKMEMCVGEGVGRWRGGGVGVCESECGCMGGAVAMSKGACGFVVGACGCPRTREDFWRGGSGV